MFIKAQCQCGKSVNAPHNYAGKKVRCPQCKEKLYIPAVDAEEELVEVHSASKTNPKESELLETIGVRNNPEIRRRGEVPKKSRRNIGVKKGVKSKTRRTVVREDESEVREQAQGLTWPRLFFSQAGWLAWGPIVITILLLAALSDASRGVGAGRGRRSGLKAIFLMVGSSLGFGGSIFLGMLFTTIGSTIFYLRYRNDVS